MHKKMTPPILCDELIMEILSWLPVNSLLRFKCVSKSFQSFISNPSFVKLHLQRSPKSVNFLLQYTNNDTLNQPFIIPYPVASLLDKPLSLVAEDPGLGFDMNGNKVIGTCNGLVCFVNISKESQTCTFRVWNPATRKTFEDPQCALVHPPSCDVIGTASFGYDNLSDTYKVVTIFSYLNFDDGSLDSCDVNVCSISDDNCWRKIQSFPADATKIQGGGVYLNNTLNWIALALPRDHNYDNDHHSDIRFDELVIVSLDLRNETFMKLLLLPSGLDGVRIDDFHSDEFNCYQSCPSFGVLKDCLSLFLHNRGTKCFSIWQMKEFGDPKSWTLLLNIATLDLQIDSAPCFDLLPLIMFEYGGILIIDSTYHPLQAIIYDGKYKKLLQHCQISCNIQCIYAMDYIQSLVPPRRY